MASPVHVRIEYRERSSRLSTLARGLLVVPHLVFVLLLGLAAWILTVAAWLVIIATGRYPRAFFGFVSGTLRYSTRVGCYWLLVTDRFPPFGLTAGPDGYPVSVWVDSPAGARGRRPRSGLCWRCRRCSSSTSSPSSGR